MGCTPNPTGMGMLQERHASVVEVHVSLLGSGGQSWDRGYLVKGRELSRDGGQWRKTGSWGGRDGMRWGERNELVCCSTAPRPALPLAGQGQARQDRVWTDLDAGNAGSGVDKLISLPPSHAISSSPASSLSPLAPIPRQLPAFDQISPIP